MDVETSEAIENLGTRVDNVERSLRAEIRSEIRGLHDQLRAEFRAGLSENRRHSEVLSESLRDDIRMVAEGLAVLSAKLDRPRL